MGKDDMPVSGRKNGKIRDIVRVREEGFQEGLAKGRQEILDWLQAAYLGPKAPDRDTPEAAAILSLARDASLHFRQGKP